MMRWNGKACVVALAAAIGTAGAQMRGNTIPPVHGTTLSGDAVDLPQALAGRAGVLIVGFSEASRTQATDWGKRLAGDFHDSRTVTYYELPVLESVPRMLRGFVLKRIAGDVSDRAKPHFLPVLDHEREWKALAAYDKSDDAYVLVVDASGAVRGRVEGAPTEASYTQLKGMLSAIPAK